MSRLSAATNLLTLLALVLFAICAVWSFVLGEDDWDVLYPFYLWIFIGQQISFAGFVCAIVEVVRQKWGTGRDQLAIPVNAVMLAFPWLLLV